MMDKTHASIPLLYDLDGSVMASYGLAFEIPDDMKQAHTAVGFPDANPGTGWLIPIPATYVIGRSGTVHTRYINTNHTYRMEPADIIAALSELAKGDQTTGAGQQ